METFSPDVLRELNEEIWQIQNELGESTGRLLGLLNYHQEKKHLLSDLVIWWSRGELGHPGQPVRLHAHCRSQARRMRLENPAPPVPWVRFHRASKQ